MALPLLKTHLVPETRVSLTDCLTSASKQRLRYFSSEPNSAVDRERLLPHCRGLNYGRKVPRKELHSCLAPVPLATWLPVTFAPDPGAVEEDWISGLSLDFHVRNQEIHRHAPPDTTVPA